MKFDYANPYPSARLPVFARNLVATSQPIAAQAGLAVLRQGGNAVDAAVATAAAMTVCEPTGNGLGSDAFCILWDGQQLHGLNASGPAPQGWSSAYFRRKYGAGASSPPLRGIDSVTVPGAVGAWAALHERFGRLPFDQVLAPAVGLAENGYLVPVVMQPKWAAGAAELGAQPGFAATFLPHGRPPAVGEVFRMPNAARALRLIGQTRGAAFYQGEIAAAIERFATAHGGVLRQADLAAYQPEWVTPLSMDYRGYTLHEIGPSTQGIAALMALGILSHFDVPALGLDSAASYHLQIEAMKLAFADVYRHVAEPSAMTVTAQQMLDAGYLQSRAALIDMQRAQDFGPGLQPTGGTIYLTAADDSGMMVSFIQSNYLGFGSGCVEPDFGISLQNRGHGFSLTPGNPNEVAPGKRPFHTIVPAFVTRAGQPVMSFGVMGAHMQPQGHVQTLLRMVDFGQNPQAACDAPRWRVNQGLSVNLEPTAPAHVAEGLRARGHQLAAHNDVYQDFGAGQFIWRLDDELGNPAEAPSAARYVAASDPRRDGQVAGY